MQGLLPSPVEMYAAVEHRDASYEGVFLICVKTTGIFCRPGCTARTPKRVNVEFVRSVQEAMLRGYRPCKICRPTENGVTHPEWVRQLMLFVQSQSKERVTDADLREKGIEPTRARRYYQRHFGMTFHAWQRSWRLGMATAQLREGTGIDEAGLDNGFDSTSGFREAFARLFGQPPGRVSEVDCLFAQWLETPLGPMIAAASGDGVCLLEFLDRRAIERQVQILRQRFDAVVVPGENEHLISLQEEVADYFAGVLCEFTTPLDLRGAPFQMAVWEQLQTIPFGTTTSYAEIAARLGRPKASRAVGRANGENRLAILVPCHRVVRSDGELCGYGGGLWRKRWLIEHEQAVVTEATTTR